MTSAHFVIEKVFQELHTSQIRNVCIIAPVDHGKTTLADHLISSNGIFPARQAGTLRYMDSREDEQAEQLTMKASAISLFYDPLLVNLIDSPGHKDFGSEVWLALNLADIVVLVVDVVGGACSQTESLLRQAISRKLDVILVVNKLDRMIVELELDQSKAFQRIQRLIEHINSFMSQILQRQLSDEDRQETKTAEKSWHFDPTKGNVIFSSALYGYAFSLDEFALLWSKKLGVDKAELGKHLFSVDHFLSAKMKQVLPEAEAKGKKPLLEQLVLDPLFELHKCALVEKDLDRLKTLAAKLGLAQLRSRNANEAFQEMMQQWMPLTNALVKVFRRMKSAATAFAHDDRLLQICATQINPLWQPIRNCDPAEKDALAYVAKIFEFCGKKVALCRIMCGTVRQGCQLKILDEQKCKSGNSVVIRGIYIIVGKELLPVEAAPAGRICALEFQDERWFNGHLLCSRLISDGGGEYLLKFKCFQEAEPLLRVTIQPNLAGGDHLEELRACLRQLYVLDGGVRVLERKNGDSVLIAAGKVHLQKCLKDLSDFGQTNIKVSKPNVIFLNAEVVDDLSQSGLMSADLLHDVVQTADKLLRHDMSHVVRCLVRQTDYRAKLDGLSKWLKKNRSKDICFQNVTGIMNNLVMNPLIGSRQFCAIWRMVDVLNKILLSNESVAIEEPLSFQKSVLAFQRSFHLFYLGAQFHPMPDRSSAFMGAFQAVGRLNASSKTKTKHMWMLKKLLEAAFSASSKNLDEQAKRQITEKQQREAMNPIAEHSVKQQTD